LYAQSQQIAREGLQKNRLRTVEVKITAWKHSDLTGPYAARPPDSASGKEPICLTIGKVRVQI
jgi:hypothetical protein